MSNRTPLLFLSAVLVSFAAGCSSSDDPTPVSTDTGTQNDSDGTDTASDGAPGDGTPTDTSTADVSSDATTVCESHGGQCIALTATSKCPEGYASSSDSCSGVGSMCCEPIDGDASADASPDAHD